MRSPSDPWVPGSFLVPAPGGCLSIFKRSPSPPSPMGVLQSIPSSPGSLSGCLPLTTHRAHLPCKLSKHCREALQPYVARLGRGEGQTKGRTSVHDGVKTSAGETVSRVFPLCQLVKASMLSEDLL